MSIARTRYNSVRYALRIVYDVAAVVSVHAEFNDMKDLHVSEQQLVSQFIKLSTVDSHQHLALSVQRQLTDVQRALEPLGPDIQLIHMRQTGSIAVYFGLMSLPDLHRFVDLHQSNRLQTVLDGVFLCLSITSVFRLVIRRLVCHAGDDLSQHVQHLQILQGTCTARHVVIMMWYTKLYRVVSVHASKKGIHP